MANGARRALMTNATTTHTYTPSGRWLSLSRTGRTSHEEELWVGQLAVKQSQARGRGVMGNAICTYTGGDAHAR